MESDVRRAKSRACPFCIRPLADDEFADHLGGCELRDFKVLRARIGAPAHCPEHETIAEYVHFATYSRDYFPPHWSDDLQVDNTRLYDVPPGGAEWFRVASAVGPRPLKGVQRVQNKELFLRYTEHVAAHPGGSERRVFHGTAPGNLPLICAQGFDAGRSKHGVYGHGIYASTSADYSIGYAKGCGKLLLCRAWTTRDEVATDIHVLLDDFAIYPEYVLAC